MKWLIGATIAGLILMAIKGEKAISAGVEAVIDAMSAAIQEFEGWYPGSRSFRNNNPGNLRNVQGLAGQIGLDETGHIIFNSYASGLAALKRQLRLVFTGGSHIYSPADSLASFFSKYAEGNQAQYAAYVAGRLGVDVNTTFQQLSS